MTSKFSVTKSQVRGKSDGREDIRLITGANSEELLRKWIHQPSNSDCDEQEGQERPEGIFQAFYSSLLGEKCEGYGDYNCKK